MGCALCEAQEWLDQDDWEVIRFYQFVSDQVVNLAPLGTKDDKPWLAPILSEWLLAAQLLNIEDPLQIIQQTRFLHSFIQERVPGMPYVFQKDPDDMMADDS